MKKQYWVFVFVMYFVSSSASADGKDGKVSNNFAFAYHVAQHQNDYGVGLNITSPLLFKERFAFRLKSNLLYNQNVLNGRSERMPYSSHSLSLIIMGGMVDSRMRLYGDLGLTAILPSSKFSSETLVPAAYGVFGFEFFFTPQANYYIELGGMGTTDKGRADKIATQPIYGNGLVVGAGIRLFLKGKSV